MKGLTADGTWITSESLGYVLRTQKLEILTIEVDIKCELHFLASKINLRL